LGAGGLRERHDCQKDQASLQGSLGEHELSAPLDHDVDKSPETMTVPHFRIFPNPHARATRKVSPNE
jgi:hypothetical protein